jgi:hypothetical protein
VGSDKNMQQRRCATCGHGDGNHLDDGCHRDASRCPCKAFVDSGFTAEAFQEYERVYARLAAAEAERDALKAEQVEWRAAEAGVRAELDRAGERTRNVVRERDEARALLAIPATLDDVLRTEAEMGQVALPAALSEAPDFGGHRLRSLQAKLREACGEPCAGEDEADAAIGLLRVTRGQRDDAWRREREALAEALKLRAFKDFVHRRLDSAGVPTHPDGPHSKEGCRVGDRLDIVIEERDTLKLQCIGLARGYDLPIDDPREQVKDLRARLSAAEGALGEAKLALRQAAATFLEIRMGANVATAQPWARHETYAAASSGEVAARTAEHAARAALDPAAGTLPHFAPPCGSQPEGRWCVREKNHAGKHADDNTPPTHRCKVCGALWFRWPAGTWSLRSPTCGPCCDNAQMGEQIEALPAPPPGGEAAKETTP